MIITQYKKLPQHIKDALEYYEFSDLKIDLNDELGCFAEWPNGCRLTSCNKNGVKDRVQNIINSAGTDENFGITFFDLKTGEKFKIVVKEVELEKA